MYLGYDDDRWYQSPVVILVAAYVLLLVALGYYWITGKPL